MKSGILLFTYGCVVLFASTMMARAADEKPVDVFEQIAKIQTEQTSNVASNPIPKLPDRQLPWDAKPKAAFSLGEKITTQAQLDEELKKMRVRYAPFMQDLAPDLDTKRERLELKEFAWRYETPEDVADINRAHKGEGNWKTVTIPHYWGPLNNATSYYRAELTLDDRMLRPEDLVIHFQAVDYLTDVYVNGQHVGFHEGLFDAFEFDIKPYVKPGKNVLVVKVRNQAIQMGDNLNLENRQYGPKFGACGGPGWDEPGKGWHMCPPGFGIWQRAWLEARSGTSIKDIFVRPLPDENKAELWLEVAQKSDAPVGISYSVYGQNFQATLAENQTATAAAQVQPDGTRLYKIEIPFPTDLRWWSTEDPWLYQIQVKLTQDGKVVDAAKKQFGMRTFTQSKTSTPKGRYYLNGKEVKLRGANMMGNLMQNVIKGDFDQLRDDILIAKIAHMNFWRMTQQPCQEEVFDYFDRLGMMTQTDMPIFVGIWKEKAPEALRQVAAMERLVRSHPSNATITYINEPYFIFHGERKRMMSKPELLALFTLFDKAVFALNPDQVVKPVDGDIPNISTEYADHHCFTLWYRDHTLPFRRHYFGAWTPTPPGWMHGCGEFGAEGMDSIEFMKKYYPKEWTAEAPDGTWSPVKLARNQTLKLGPPWFGFTPTTMKEWVETSQNHQMWAVRLQTEAMRRDPKMNSYALAHSIDAFPAAWMKTVMSYDRTGKPAFFAFLQANAPLALSLRPERFYSFSGEPVRMGAWVLNDTTTVPKDATLRYQVKLGDRAIKTGQTAANITPSNPEFEGWLTFEAPAVVKRQPMTVDLGLFDAKGKILADTSHTIDLFPAADKPADTSIGGPADAGGHPQRLIETDMSKRAAYAP